MKRFTETQKWDDPWFRRLSPEMKLLWIWLLDRCDNAGVIDPDIDLASFHIGYPYPMDTLSEFGERLIKLPTGKWFIPKFIDFQYGKLSEDCKAHNPVFASLEKHGLKGYPYPIHTLQEKERVKEREKDKDSYPITNGNHMVSDEGDGVIVSLPEVKSSGRRFPDHAAICARINALRPEWGRPAQWGAQELHDLHGALGQIEELTEDDWNGLKAYLNAKMPEGAGYWQPRNRGKFIQTLSNVFADYLRWSEKSGTAPTVKKKGFA